MTDVDSMIGAFFPTPIEDYIERLYERVKGMECTKLERLHVLQQESRQGLLIILIFMEANFCFVRFK